MVIRVCGVVSDSADIVLVSNVSGRAAATGGAGAAQQPVHRHTGRPSRAR